MFVLLLMIVYCLHGILNAVMPGQGLHISGMLHLGWQGSGGWEGGWVGGQGSIRRGGGGRGRGAGEWGRGPKSLCTKNGPTRFSTFVNFVFSLYSHFGLEGGEGGPGGGVTPPSSYGVRPFYYIPWWGGGESQQGLGHPGEMETGTDYHFTLVALQPSSCELSWLPMGNPFSKRSAEVVRLYGWCGGMGWDGGASNTVWTFPNAPHPQHDDCPARASQDPPCWTQG